MPPSAGASCSCCAASCPTKRSSRLRHADREIFVTLARKLARFAQDFSERIRRCPPCPARCLSDRAQDNWEALFAIAECAGPKWVEYATDAALKLSNDSAASASRGNELLADIKAVFERQDGYAHQHRRSARSPDPGRYRGAVGDLQPRQAARRHVSWLACLNPTAFIRRRLGSAR